jgi:hypothetical protein
MKNLIQQREGEIPLERAKRKPESNIKKDLQKLDSEFVDSIYFRIGTMEDSCEYGNEYLCL